ncbi:HPP family protein [Marinoscillum furvescens]|uniref:HPP family protein n=1 Tax=Marinoscillum furvescens DSM 4134 TaxID=1122208 RepID=A0A3D9KY55_MARFU|nr:HPP family protein [Marinoscillum furvescens]RED92289.1 HPP family protein [Marinoscillum furvescens DSM 4134]
MVSKHVKRNYRIVRYVLYKETLLNTREHVWSFLGAFCGIGLLATCQGVWQDERLTVLLIGSFGASSVLVFGAIQSPYAQPRNLIGGHVLSAVIGVACQQLLGADTWYAAAFAVALAIIGMQYSKTVHPPGGATALIAVIGGPQIVAMGWWYVLMPVLVGALVLLVVALVFNNLTADRAYPTSGRFTRIIRRRQQGGRGE